MKKSLVALAALTAIAGAAQAQSSVTLYGIVDAAVRISDNEGAGKDNLTRLVGGGLSQGRWGMTINEDLGGGLRAVANMEQRVTTDDGAQANGVQWSQVWVGLQSSSLGRLTLGRQFNVLFDVVTTTYPSFKFSPYIETFKPETVWMGGSTADGTNLLARNANSAKYTLVAGGLTLQGQASAGEGSLTIPKTLGFSAKYVFGPVAVGGGYIQEELNGGPKVDVYTVGVGFTSGPVYLNASYYKTEYDPGLPATYITPLITGTGLAAIVGTNSAAQTGEREAFMIGGTYNITPAILIGAQYWGFEQTTITGQSNGKYDAFAILADYAFSKRTDAYAVVDFTKLKDGARFNGTASPGGTLANTGANDRTSFMVGVRHRF